MVRITAVAVAIAAAALVGCAAQQQQIAEQMGTSQAAVGGTVGAAGGAIAGNVLGRVLNLDRTATTVIGAAVGGVVGYQSGRQRDLEAAEAARARMQSRGIAATVETVELVAPSTNHAMTMPASQPQRERALKRFAAPIPAAALRTQAPEARDTLRDIGALAASNSAPTSVSITAPDKRSAEWAKGEVLAGAGGKGSVRVVATVDKSAGITMLPDYTTVASAK